MFMAMSGHRIDCPRAAVTTMARRAPLLRSMSGPSSGDTMANGARVNKRYSSTLWSAAVGEMEKNSDPASEIVTTVAPPSMAHCTRDSRPIGCVWSNRSFWAWRAMTLNCSTLADIATDANVRCGVPVTAYVLIQTDVGTAAQVAQQVDGIEGVTLAEGVTGPYDVIARVEAQTIDQLGRLVVGQVQQVEGITRTVTCPVVTL